MEKNIYVQKVAEGSVTEPSTIPTDSYQSASIAKTEVHIDTEVRVDKSPASQSDPLEIPKDSATTSFAINETPLRSNVTQGPKRKKSPATMTPLLRTMLNNALIARGKI